MQTGTPHPERLPLRVALVEDDVNFQHALTAAIGSAADMALSSVASTRAQGLAMLQAVPADVLLVDLGLPDGSGIDLIRSAQVLWPDCDVMVITTLGDEAHVMRSIEAGARGYLLKDSTAEKMLTEIRNLHAGGSPISPLIARRILMRFQRPMDPVAAPVERADGHKPRALLSERETQVLEYITKGFNSNEIATLMAISFHTVQTYVRRIYAKLEVTSKTEAVYEALHQGLVQR